MELDAEVRRFSGGRTLFGGSPLRVVRLSDCGATLLDRWLAGEPIGDAGAAAALARRLLDIGFVHPISDAGAAMFTPADVTLVVPVKDDAAGLARLLAHVGPVAARLIVDDGSRPPLTAAALRHPVARGPAAARETGWRRATTEFIAFLDADVVPQQGWLEGLLPLFDDPAVAAVAPRVHGSFEAGHGSGGVLPAAIARYEDRRSSLDMGTRPGVVRPLSTLGYVPSAALVVRRSALAEVGGFDERLRFGEDVDLVWRLTDAGYLVRYQPAVTVRHRPRATLRAWLRQRFDYGSSAAPLAARHPDRLSPAVVQPWSAVIWMLVAARRPIPAVVLAIATTARAKRALCRRGLPPATALTVAATGHLTAGRALASAVRRTWWPFMMPTRMGRRALLLSVAPPVAEALVRRASLPDVLLRIADDVAYSAGVWAGCLRHREPAPLLPRTPRQSK